MSNLPPNGRDIFKYHSDKKSIPVFPEIGPFWRGRQCTVNPKDCPYVVLTDGQTINQVAFFPRNETKDTEDDNFWYKIAYDDLQKEIATVEDYIATSPHIHDDYREVAADRFKKTSQLMFGMLKDKFDNPDKDQSTLCTILGKKLVIS